jgi:hypothetical protein
MQYSLQASDAGRRAALSGLCISKCSYFSEVLRCTVCVYAGQDSWLISVNAALSMASRWPSTAQDGMVAFPWDNLTTRRSAATRAQQRGADRSARPGNYGTCQVACRLGITRPIFGVWRARSSPGKPCLYVRCWSSWQRRADVWACGSGGGHGGRALEERGRSYAVERAVSCQEARSSSQPKRQDANGWQAEGSAGA